jgi:hypothetical protein
VARRALDRVTEAHLPLPRAGRAQARAAAWAAGAGSDVGAKLCLDLDATIVVAHSDKELVAPTCLGVAPSLTPLLPPTILTKQAPAAQQPSEAGRTRGGDRLRQRVDTKAVLMAE